MDGVYDADPLRVPTARRYDRISYADMLSQKLRIMDLTAISMCMDNNVPIIVFDMKQEGSIEKAIRGERIGTLVGDI